MQRIGVLCRVWLVFMLILINADKLSADKLSAFSDTESPVTDTESPAAETESPVTDTESPAEKTRRRAGKNKGHTMLGVSLGYSFSGYRDEIESLMNRYMNTLTYMLDASFERGKMMHLLNFNFLIGSPRMYAPYKGYNHEDSTSGKFLLSYTFDYQLWGGQKFPGYIGGSFRTLVHYAFLSNSEIYSPPAALVIFSLNLHICQKWIINKRNSLALSLGYPLLGYIIRPSYSGMDEVWERYLAEKRYFKMLTLGETGSFHNYWAFWGDLKYYFRINSLILLNSGLGFEISHVDSPEHRPRKDSMFQLMIGITFNF